MLSFFPSASGTPNPSIDLKQSLAFLSSQSEGTQPKLGHCTQSLCV